MKPLIPLVVAGAVVSLVSQSAIAQEKKPLGYQDTPLIPGTQWHVHDGLRPQPKVVTPGEFPSQAKPSKAPSDAVVLFDGKDLSQWTGKSGSADWKVENGYAEVNGTGDIVTKGEFGPDLQLHVEWASPMPPEATGQGRGNSGIFFFGKYEVQVLDCFENQTYPDGQATAVYGQTPPLVNASLPPGQWQTYDILFSGPRFGADGKLEKPAFVTILHNGVVVQNHTQLLGNTPHKKVGTYEPHPEKGAIKLQDHRNPVRYRNIWVRELKPVDSQ